MAVKWKTKVNRLPQVTTTAETIAKKTVKVGAFKGDHAWLASIMEYGADIKATRAQYLTVPVCSEAAGKKAGEIPDLFVYTSQKGNKMLARNENGSLKFYYWLTPSVKIPERSFIRSGHDENIDRIIKQTERAVGQVLAGKMDLDTMLDVYGEQMTTAIKTYMRNLSSPPNSPITVEVKGSSNPLIGQTNGLVESITWKKE